MTRKIGRKYQPLNSAPRPTLPVDTARVARSVFNTENLYLAIGDQFDVLFDNVIWDKLSGFSGKPARTLFILAMVTIFQFAEDLPDDQAADAVRTRMDWKYALHLALDYPCLDPSELYEFRQQLLLDSEGQTVFQRMLIRLAKTGILGGKDKRQADVTDVLMTVNILSRVVKVAQAMSLALEALAASQPTWLLAISLPHWYERYGQMLTALQWHGCREKQEALAQAIGADIAYLLEAMGQADKPELNSLDEVQALNQVWREQYWEVDGKVLWRKVTCADVLN
jgi:transposase